MVLLAIAGAVAGWLIWGAACVWPITAMGLTAMALLLACIFVLRGGFLLELKRRFHFKIFGPCPRDSLRNIACDLCFGEIFQLGKPAEKPEETKEKGCDRHFKYAVKSVCFQKKVPPCAFSALIIP